MNTKLLKPVFTGRAWLRSYCCLSTDVGSVGVRRIARNGPARWSSFLGAGALISVGYMDPGNWATAVAAGAKYGYQLLIVVLAASLIGLFMQCMASKVGLVTGRDLAQLCRERCKRRTTILLWIASEIAIIACDVAELVGSAVALQLLLGVSLTVGVLLSAVSAFAMLALQSGRQRHLQFLISGLIIFVGLCFFVEVKLANPSWRDAMAGFAPSASLLRDSGMIWLCAGMVGATVMPHNLYLHSALVKKHAKCADEASICKAVRSVNIGTFVSLSFAFLVNAALLIVAAAVFNASGNREVTDLAEAHRLIVPLVGNNWAGITFAAALLACGLNATVTGTIAGQVVMEGFLRLRSSPWLRALVTRTSAIGPALFAVGSFGEHGSNQLLIASQIVLSIQLPMALIPLVRFGSDAGLMGIFRVKGVPLVVAWACIAIIVTLNTALLWQTVMA